MEPPPAPPAGDDDEDDRAPPASPPTKQLRQGQRRLLLLRQQGLVLTLLRKRAAHEPQEQQQRGSRTTRRRRRGTQVHATLRWCHTHPGEEGGKPKAPVPTREDLAALQAHRHLSRRRRRVLRAQETRLRARARQRAQFRARQAYKRRYKHKRQEELERQAVRRIARALRADAEAAAASGVEDSTVGSLVARPIMAPPTGGHGSLQPWATARVKCESASALVQQTLKASQLLPPEEAALSGLYDQMLIVGLPLESMRDPLVQLGGTYAPQVVYTYPEGALATESVADFCLPQGVTITPIDPATGQPQPRPVSPTSAPLPSGLCSRQRAKLATAALEAAKEVLFVLSGGGADGSETSYGMCLHVRRPYLFSDRVAAEADLCYCFIAKRPFLTLHLGVLRGLVRMHLFPPEDQPRALSPGSYGSSKGTAARPLHTELEREKTAVLRITRVLHRLAVLPVPAPGEEVTFHVFEGMPQALALPTYFRRPPPPTPVAAAWGATVTLEGAEDDETTRLVREWAAPVLLSLVGLERVLMVLFSMLTEAQIVVVSPDPQVLSASVLALAALVRPLVWAGPLIATLPQKHGDYLDSPVPLIVGVEALPRGFQPPKGMVLVYPERDAIAFHPAETAFYTDLFGHQVAWLLRALRDAQRRLRPSSTASPSPTKQQKQQSKQPKQEQEGTDSPIFPAPRALSPAYGSQHRREGQQQHFWCGSAGTVDPEEEAKPSPPAKTPQQPDPRAVEEVVRAVRQHIAAVAEAALSIDLVHRPRRAVLDRRRSTIVEEKTLEPEMQSWWQECLGMESGALFMKRFMDTQMYSNYRYSDAIRKRDMNVALGADAFRPKYRPLGSTHNPPHLETIGEDSWSLSGDAEDGTQQEPQPGAVVVGEGAEEEGGAVFLPQEAPLAELFSMAISGGTAAPAVAEEFSYEALVPLAEAGLLCRPCNGMCAGRCDTEDCTDICLELWHHKIVHLRRREIVRGQRFLALPHARPYAHWRPVPASPPRSARHRLELPSQYRRRLMLARGEEVLSRRRRLREKGRNALRFRLLLQIASERQRVERHAGLVILGALRRHHGRCQRARLLQGVVQLQAAWRGYRRRKEIRAFRLIDRGLRRYIHRFRLQRWRATAARALSKHRQEAAAAAAAAETVQSGTFVPLSPTGSPGGKGSSPKAGATSPGSGGGGGGLWQYLKKRREGIRSPSPKPAATAAGAGESPVVAPNSSPNSGGDPAFFPPSPPPSASGHNGAFCANRPVSQLDPTSPAATVVTRAASPTTMAVATIATSPLRPPQSPSAQAATTPTLQPHTPTTPPASSSPSLPALAPQEHADAATQSSPQLPGGRFFTTASASSPTAAQTASPPPSPLPSPTTTATTTSPPRPAQQQQHDARNSLISPGIRAACPVVSVPEYGSGGIREEDAEQSLRAKAGGVAVVTPVRGQQHHHHRAPTGAGDGAEGSGAYGGDEEEDQEGVEEDEAAVVAGAMMEARRLPPRLLGDSPRQLLPSEKGPLPLSELRRGLRVRKLDRKGRPHGRLFRLEDKGSLAYAPRLAWRPLGVAGRALRALLQSQKPCTLTLSEAVGGVDSSGKTPRIIMALTHKPPLLRPVPGSDPPRYLVFAINDGDRDVEFELCIGRGVEAEQAVEYYMRLLATLQTLCAQAAPHSPSTPKP